ncbi:MAG: hypothetical protein CMJ58_21070 [Planctomycetaceae bacterium]|nr:hypothetical protein [Planctomycetaceae bacterium]
MEQTKTAAPKSKKKITKTDVNFWLDVFLMVVFVVLLWSAVVVQYVFPPGPKTEGWTLWGGDYQTWCGIQFGTLCLFAASVVLHVMLHWTWVCGVVASRWAKDRSAAKDDGIRTLWGVGLLIAVLNVIGIGVAIAKLTVVAP